MQQEVIAQDYTECAADKIMLMLIKRRATQLNVFVEINYGHDHVMITKLYMFIVVRVLYARHLY